MTHHDEALERVARAMAPAAWAECDAAGVTDTEMGYGRVTLGALSRRAKSLKDARTAIEAISAGAEPVAWRWRFRPEDGWTVGRDKPAQGSIPRTGEVQPLYAASPPLTETREADIRADERERCLAIVQAQVPDWVKERSGAYWEGYREAMEDAAEDILKPAAIVAALRKDAGDENQP